MSQADSLPDTITANIEGIEKLKGAENFDTWEFFALKTLKLYSLDGLLKGPRPSPTHAKYTHWRGLSLRVGLWLSLQVDTKIVQQLTVSSTPIDYADEVYTAIKRIVIGHGHEQAGYSYLAAVSMKREDYGTTEQFVTAFRQHVQIANRQNTPISPYSAALLLTEALKDELPIWVETIRYNFRATVASDMSDNELLMLYEQAIDKGREREKSFIAAKPTNKGNNFASSNLNHIRNRMRGQPTLSKRQVPPQGMDTGKWVEQFFNGIQRTDGKCTYCQWGAHNCTKCWYLNPDQRPPGWEPSQGLWAYYGPQLYVENRHTPDPPELQVSNMSRQMEVEDDEINVYDMTRPLV
jgi:hypothetical protein